MWKWLFVSLLVCLIPGLLVKLLLRGKTLKRSLYIPGLISISGGLLVYFILGFFMSEVMMFYLYQLITTILASFIAGEILFYKFNKLAISSFLIGIIIGAIVNIITPLILVIILFPGGY